MKKIKLYLDTSVISHLHQSNKPYEQSATKQFWDNLKTGLFEIVVSDIVWQELNACKDKMLTEKLCNELHQITHNNLEATADMFRLGDDIIKEGVLPKSSIEDSQHIAAALLSECDYLVTWNFTHLANYKTNRNVRLLSIKGNYKELSIVAPIFFLEGGKNENKK